MKKKVVIIGAGVAGYTAAIYTARAGLEPIIITGNTVGGQLTLSHEIENYPGFINPISGIELTEKMYEQAKRLGAEFLIDNVEKIDSHSRPFTVHTSNDRQIETDSIILATGASARWLHVDGEDEFRGKGVSACATCDGFFYRGKTVIVVGGGNTAVYESIYLSDIAEKVYHVHRGEFFRAEKVLQDKLFKKDNVEIIWNSEVKKIMGENGGVEQARILDRKTMEETTLDIDGIFVAIGQEPSTGFLKGSVDLDDRGFIITEKDSTSTTIEGIYAAGDAMDPDFQQAIVAAGTGCKAAMQVEKYLIKKDK